MAEFIGGTSETESNETEREGRLLDGQLTGRIENEVSERPVLRREIAALLLLVLLCDLTIYRSRGFAGPAVLFLLSPLLLCLGSVRWRMDAKFWFLAGMLYLVSARLLWCGSDLAEFSGFVLTVFFAMGLVGVPPYLTQAVIYAWSLFAVGYRRLCDYQHKLSPFSPVALRGQWFAIGLPLITVTTFAAIFVMANPELVVEVGRRFNRLAEFFQELIRHFQFSEVLFCVGAGWLVAGALYPVVRRLNTIDRTVPVACEFTPSPLYAAYRNTLLAMTGLFIAYLGFEFQTLWFKVFPEHFHYSGYAHEGAAWLTVALGLATLMLSLIFRGSILVDLRLARLRVLAWIWSIENLLLASAVFNRLFIYVGFNGMTRMRVVGMFGVASVVFGFLLVVRKIASNQNFAWLIHRQLWTVSLAVYLYAVLPVDAFVNWFNVDRIMKGNFAPCVQISVHPTTYEGLLCLKPLLRCPNETIREGVRAILSEKLDDLESSENSLEHNHWTTAQIARIQLARQLGKAKADLKLGQTIERRDQALKEYHKYAFHWY